MTRVPCPRPDPSSVHSSAQTPKQLRFVHKLPKWVDDVTRHDGHASRVVHHQNFEHLGLRRKMGVVEELDIELREGGEKNAERSEEYINVGGCTVTSTALMIKSQQAERRIGFGVFGILQREDELLEERRIIRQVSRNEVMACLHKPHECA